MKRSEIETLTKILQIVVKKELKLLKEEILSEIRQPSLGSQNQVPKKKLQEKAIQTQFRQQYKIQQSKPRLYAKDPLLNDLLMNTEPAPEDNIGAMQYLENDDLPNLPTTEHGQFYAPQNKQTNAVLEAMNRDYSQLVERMDQDSGKTKEQFRNQILSRMDPIDSEPEEEDMSWLSEVG